MSILYFDNAATTKISEEVLEKMMPYLTVEYGNPSSVYSMGRKSKRAIEEAREDVAKLIGCDSKEIYFTGCGSESDNTALKGVAYTYKDKGKHIITSKIEHPAILETCKTLQRQGFKITYLNVNEDGLVDLNELVNNIKTDTILISVMFANNEIGTIEPIEKIAKIAKEKDIVFHTDAVQAVGNVPIDVKKIGIDMLSMSAHKFNGPKGVGALYVKSGIKFDRFLDGGHQEKNKRAGTENVAGIVGMGKASELALKKLDNHILYLTELKDYYINQIEKNIKDSKLNGSREKRLPGNASFSFKNINGRELLYNLDLKGICASSGSACTSGMIEPSHVLTAIGLQEEWANGTLRVSFGDNNSKNEINILVKEIIEIIKNMKAGII